jgi:hypothetical protein
MRQKLEGKNLDITIWRCVQPFSLRYRYTENIVILHSKSDLQAYQILIDRISLHLGSLYTRFTVMSKRNAK